MSRPSFGSYLRDNYEEGSIIDYTGVVHERPGHKGLVLTITPHTPNSAGPWATDPNPRSYLIRGELLIDVTRSSAKK